jgi:hypothetical protein
MGIEVVIEPGKTFPNDVAREDEEGVADQPDDGSSSSMPFVIMGGLAVALVAAG